MRGDEEAERRLGGGLTRLRHEMAGGLAAGLAALSIAVPLGPLVFAPLGPSFAGVAAAAGLVSAALGGFVACLVGGTPTLRSGPMTALALVVSALIATLLQLPGMTDPVAGPVPRVVVIALVCVAASGAIEMALGLLRLGTAIKFVPRPVLAGFRNGLAILIATSQLAPLTGVDPPFPWSSALAQLKPSSLLVGAVSVAAVLVMRRLRLTSVALFAGLVAGTVAHRVLALAMTSDALGRTLGPLPGFADTPTAWHAAQAGASALWSPATLHALPSAATIALVGGVLSLLAARVVDDVAGTRHDSNRVLFGQGVGNLVAGFAGGVPVAGSPAASIASIRAGGRGLGSALVSTLFLLAALAFGAPWIAQIPMAALAGVMVVIAIDLVDHETFGLVGDVARGGERAHDALPDLAIVVAVAAASIAVNIVAGVATGVLISTAIFAIKSSRDVVRRFATGRERRSLRQRGDEAVRALGAAGERFALLELEGPIFFGTSERLADEVARRAGDARFVILDFARVNAIDATGAHVVAELAGRLARRDGRLVVASLRARSHGRRMLERAAPGGIVFMPDADRALEWCEERVLAEAGLPDDAGDERPLAAIDLCRELDADELAKLAGVLVREQHPAGAVLFREGDTGDTLYLLAKGAVSMVLRESDRDAPGKRVVTFAPGVAFGELALLEGRPRSAEGVCESEVVVHRLSRGALHVLGERDPKLAIKLYRAIALSLAGRLRATTHEVRLAAH